MSEIKKNYSLKAHNTFNISVKSKYFASFRSNQELINLLQCNVCKTEKILLLGGGSNILFTKDFNGITLLNAIKGIKIIHEDTNYKKIKVGAGEVWHDFVLWCVKEKLYGIENLALIPGLVGATPIQNIGAYGVEVKDVIEAVNYIDIKSKNKKTINKSSCQFSYRDSIFKKKLKNKVIITEVIFKLKKTPVNNVTYKAISDELKKMKKKVSTKNITEAVMKIRKRKLPDPKEIGNSGSFFKNPVVKIDELKRLKREFPEIVSFKISNTHVKLAAGWLIENIGYKGYRMSDAGVHKNQALVLVNYGKATGREILNLANIIQTKVKEKYNINLENEVNIL